ncbi:hypothetical protein GALL_467740 [mine drainage metagenome]|uniref:Uncharacterized protein n=1 Tax=mine drainage metagenome TaxID=410659 RepID=A0A1J5PJC3_9ZZZZ
MLLEGRFHIRRDIPLVRAIGHQRVIGDQAITNTPFGLFHQIVDAGDRRVERPGTDDAHQPRNMHGIARFVIGLIGDTEGGERGGRGFGLPHRLDRGEFHLLAKARVIAAFVTQQDDRQGRGQTEGRGDGDGTARQFDMTPLQQIPRRNAQHEDRGGDVARRDSMHEFRLRDLIEHHVVKARHLHPHRHRVEGGANRVLHPAVCDEDPQSREVRADGDQPSHDHVLHLGQLVPAEEEQADKGCLKEEGHQPFDRQRRTENVADVLAIIAPVHAELELHRQAGSDAQDEVDAEQGAPELGHLTPDGAVGHDIDRLHDRDDGREAEGQRHKQEVVKSGHRKLQARELDDTDVHLSVLRMGRKDVPATHVIRGIYSALGMHDLIEIKGAW